MNVRSKQMWAALAGLLSAAVGFALAELGALIIEPASSPLLAVGSLVIDLAPPPVKDAVIAVFGTNDKIFLLALLAVVVIIVAAAAGLIELRKSPWGMVVLAALSGVAAIAVTTRAQSSVSWAIPTVIGMIGACIVLRLAVQRLRDWTAAASRTKGKHRVERTASTRRSFLFLLGGTAVGAAVVGIGARVANAASLAVDTARDALTLPKPKTTAPAPPAGASLDVEGITPIVTPNENFYRIDTALQVPSIDPSSWSLRITGMVEKEIEITFDELLALPLEEKIITIACVSNDVGADLIGNAVWLGYPIRELLAKARPLPGADMLLSRSIDGFTAGTPLEILQEEDRDSLLAVGMNGAPLPAEHGFPVRMIVPGLFGYVSATKWVVEWELTTFDKAAAYWTQRGWAEMGPVKISSRIDVPSGRANVEAGTVPVAGVAWAQHTGIQSVEVRVDDGPWTPARLADPISKDTWVQWVYDWDAKPGNHVITARAIDVNGEVQSGTPKPVVPDGAEGWHTIPLTVR